MKPLEFTSTFNDELGVGIVRLNNLYDFNEGEIMIGGLKLHVSNVVYLDYIPGPVPSAWVKPDAPFILVTSRAEMHRLLTIIDRYNSECAKIKQFPKESGEYIKSIVHEAVDKFLDEHLSEYLAPKV